MAVLKNGISSAVGLGVYTHTTANNGMYFASAIVNAVPITGVIITIAQSGSATVSVSSPAASDTQNHIELQKVFNCTAGDVITITLASSSAIDNGINNGVIGILRINQGMS